MKLTSKFIAVFIGILLAVSISALTLGLHNKLLGLLAMTILLTAPLIVLFLFTILKPVRKLTQAARAIGQGNFAPEILISSSDEIAELAAAFQAMLHEIRTDKLKLLAYAKTLETQVAERTSELKEALVLAEAANLAKSDFLGNVSHELITPLNVTIGFANLLLDEVAGSLTAEQKKFAETIVKAGDRLLRIVTEMLDITRLETGEIDLHLERFSLKDALASAIDLMREKALTHDITISLTVTPAADILVEADEQRLKQILYNLLANAIKFNQDGGTVKVIADCRIGDSEIVISVIDTGIGIKPENIPSLFLPFKQLELSLTKKFEGVGLGLAVTKKLVELHGGRIWCESAPGKGSTFAFVLPVRKGEEG